MRTTPQTLSLLKWLAALPASVWWHLGETALWVETNAGAELPPLPEGVSLKVHILRDGNIQQPT